MPLAERWQCKSLIASLLSGYTQMCLLETGPFLGEKENVIRKRGEGRAICLVVMEQMHILMETSASSVTYRQTRVTDA